MIKLHNTDCIDLMASMKDESVDVICIDPPYLYLKNQKLERPFDEHLFFNECKRLLVDDGFIVMFGRGDSFYRWNNVLAQIGFTFKEEIIWDKSYGSSPLMAITRCHETIAIQTKGKGSIKKVKIPYKEARMGNTLEIHRDIKRIKTVLTNQKSLIALEKYLEDGTLSFDGSYEASTTVTSGRKRVDRVVSTMQMITEGMNEKSIITTLRDHYTSIHPTQKPVRLIERLLNLVLPNKPHSEVVVADFFGGSFSTMEACHNMGLNGVSCEIDQEYFAKGRERIDNILRHGKQGQLFVPQQQYGQQISLLDNHEA